MKNNLLCLTAFLLIFSFLGVANAAPIQWQVNGHYYDRINFGENNKTANWDVAKAAAEAMNGYLVTLTSADEAAFVSSNLDESGCWLGGYQESGASAPNQNWAWVTGEAWSYTNWEANNPDDLDGVENGDEDILQFVWGNDVSWAGYWNDASATSTTYSYIIEYDTNPVPIPGAVWLLGSGLLGLVAVRRRKGNS